MRSCLGSLEAESAGACLSLLRCCFGRSADDGCTAALTALVLSAVQVLKEMLPPHGPDVGIEMVSLPPAVLSSSSQHAALQAPAPCCAQAIGPAAYTVCKSHASASPMRLQGPLSTACMHWPAAQPEVLAWLPACFADCMPWLSSLPVAFRDGLLQVGMHYSKEKKHLLERKLGLETDPSDTINEIIKAGGQAALCDVFHHHSEKRIAHRWP